MKRASFRSDSSTTQGKRGPRTRSLTGLIVTLCLLPFLLANMACMDPLPVPVGNPEKGKIDPRLNGMWVGQMFDIPYILVFDSFDKRAWVMSMYGLAVDDDTGDEPRADADSPEEDTVVELLKEEVEVQLPEENTVVVLQEEDMEVEPANAAAWLDALQTVGVDDKAYWHYKVWKTKMRDTEFLTWEAGLVFDEDGLHKANLWYVWKLEWLDKDGFELSLVDDEFEDIGKVTTRRQAERLIKRNLKNSDLFEEPSYRFYRIAPGDYERAIELISDTAVCVFDDC